MKEKIFTWLLVPVTRMEIAIAIITLLILGILGCKNQNAMEYTSEAELDSLFDHDNISSLETRELLDSLLVLDSLSEEGESTLDSLRALISTDSYDLETGELPAAGHPLSRIVIHATASNVSTPYTKETLLKFFKESQHWSKPGYTFFFDRQGILWKLNEHWDWDPIVNYSEITFGAKGYNSNSLHVAWDGGVDGKKILDNRTPEQRKALLNFIKIVHDIYPDIQVMGHRDLPGVKKLCPVFDVAKEYSDILNH